MAEAIQVVVHFKEKIEDVVGMFEKMSASEKVESVLLWNQASERIQTIINISMEDLKNISIIVVQNSVNNNNSQHYFKSRSTPLSSDPLDNHPENNATITASNALKNTKQISSQSPTRNSTEKPANSRLKPDPVIIIEPPATTAIIAATATTEGKSDSTDKKCSSSNPDLCEMITPTTKELVLNPDLNKANTKRRNKSDDGEVHLADQSVTVTKKKKTNDQSICNNKANKSQEMTEGESELNKSTEKTPQKNRWSCTSCEKHFDYFVNLQEHITSEHPVSTSKKNNNVKIKPFKCTQCEASFTTKSNYNVHLRGHSGERPFACPKCSVRFTTSNNLRRHLLSHQHVKPYHCSVCDSRFAEKRSLQIHLRKHTGERPYSCPECSETFQQKSVLRSHITTHSTDKPFLCSDCGQAFKRKKLLQVHEIRHHGEKSQACHYCKATFFTKSELNRHEQSHRGEKRFQCKEPNCDKSFMRKQSLREHMSRHDGIKPYKCEPCSTAFVQLSEYLKHMKNKHPSASAPSTAEDTPDNNESEQPEDESSTSTD